MFLSADCTNLAKAHAGMYVVTRRVLLLAAVMTSCEIECSPDAMQRRPTPADLLNLSLFVFSFVFFLLRELSKVCLKFTSYSHANSTSANERVVF